MVIPLSACSIDRQDIHPQGNDLIKLKTKELENRLHTASALGTLQPIGDVHFLAGPILHMGGIPRVRSILVKEGEAIRRGQVLATFDNHDRARTEKYRILSNMSSRQSEISILESETKRYRLLQNNGAFPTAELESRELRLLGLKAQLRELQAALQETNVKIEESLLLSPINGLVLKIHSRPGERPADLGVMEIGNTHIIEAVLQVDESDIRQVRIGKTVQIRSENKSFLNTLEAKVVQIGKRVTRRRIQTSNPVADIDHEHRVIEVRARLTPMDSHKAQSLVGAKIVGQL